MSEFTEESFNALRQQLAETQAIVQQLVQERQASPSATDSSLHSPLHAFGVRLHYDWTPDLLVKYRFGLDRYLFTAPMLSDADRTSIIDNYLPIRCPSYVPPNILPEARSRMNRGQIREDNNLKSPQYLLSGGNSPSGEFQVWCRIHS
ncbi:hypothetical protein BCV72DRAFT_317654 [Rhizopus microsporus var. microsporus]|uniref:Uncharacterized protein n=1 Tax=Rhizopus microsporus var. microsporus TaxID=86635 RepID=A0A1X0QS07_RHIZD|nr:hypothetical protein BCV72DRAFT_317654 [Rhizopus microsporus var. microsporus]